MSDPNPKLERFNECRNTFVTSLNSISILSSLVFLTIFVPYTTYVGNLLAKRAEIKKETKIVSGHKEIKIVNGQKEKIPIEHLLPNFQEKEEDFELIPLPLFQTPVIDKQSKSLTVRSSDLSSIWKIGIKPLLKFETKPLKVEIQKDTKIANGQKMEIRIHRLKLDDTEKSGNFDFKKLEVEWLKAHGSSVDKTAMLSDSTEFNNPVGTFRFSKPEIVLIYPAAVSILLVYLSLHFYDLLNLKRKLKNEDEELVKIPWWRISIASFFLLLCLGCSWFIIGLPPKIPTNTSSQLVKIESRLGKIIAKENQYQLIADIDFWIFWTGVVFFVISVVVTFKACTMSKMRLPLIILIKWRSPSNFIILIKWRSPSNSKI